MAKHSSASGKRGQLPVRKVWAHNLREEFLLLVNFLKTASVWACLDTEFPGTIFAQSPPASSSDVYKNLKSNVDDTDIIQLGLTVVNSKTSKGFVWEFNFKDFNLRRGDSHKPESIQLLKDQGIDFERNAQGGIDSRLFGFLLNRFAHVFANNVAWAGFHCGIDFAYMIKMLTGQPLPTTLRDFMKMVNQLFGTQIYDMKYMMNDFPGLYGGLEKVADALGVDRFAGNCHQAGYDSFLTLQIFQKMKKQLEQPRDQNRKNVYIQEKYCNKIFGLHAFHLTIQHEDSAKYEKLRDSEEILITRPLKQYKKQSPSIRSLKALRESAITCHSALQPFNPSANLMVPLCV